LGYVALSDPQVIVAFWIGAISTIITIVIALQVLWMRISLEIDKKRIRLFSETWEPFMIHYILGDKLELPKLKSYDRLSFIMLWLHFHESLRGNITTKINALFNQLGLLKFVRQLLMKGSLDERIVAATAIGYLQDHTEWDRLVLMLDSPSPGLSITAARAMIMIDASSASELVITAIIKRRDWPISRLASILKPLKDSFLAAFSRRLEIAANEKHDYLPRLIRLFGSLNQNFIPDYLKKIIATSDDFRLVTSCLRLINDPQDIALARLRINDKDWRIQIQALAVIARIGTVADITLLVKMLSSKEWWIRYRAAHAIIDHPCLTWQDIYKLRDDLTDTYGRDIFNQVIAEKLI
jgi:HEAT repeat protein